MRKPQDTQSKSWIPLAIILAAFVLLYFLWRVLFIFILAAFFAFLIFPLVHFLDRKLPRALSILSVYLVIAILIVVTVTLLVPVITVQVDQFAHNLPGYMDRAKAFSNSAQAEFISLPPIWRNLVSRSLNEFQQGVTQLAKQSVGVIFSVFGSLLTLVFVPLLAFFMLLHLEGYKRMLQALLPSSQRNAVDNLLECVGRTLWTYFKGESILVLSVGLADGIGLFIMGMPYPALLGVMGGILEIFPSLGATITTVTVVLIGLTISPAQALKAAAVTVSVQLLENAFLVPVVMGRTVGLDPLTVSFSIFLGGTLAGVPGAVLAIPIAMIVKIMVIYFYADHSLLPEGDKATCGTHYSPRMGEDSEA